MNKQLEEHIAGYQWEISPEILDELINMVLARPLSWRELAVQYLELNGLAVDWTPLKEAILERMSAQVHEYDDTVLEAALAQNDSMYFWSYMSKHLWAEIELFHDAMVWASRHGYRADFLSERLVHLGWMRTLIRQICDGLDAGSDSDMLEDIPDYLEAMHTKQSCGEALKAMIGW